MRFFKFCPVLGCLCLLSSGVAGAENSATRTIHLRQDDAQVRFVSKIYELKYVQAIEILPFVNSAILRYNRNSTIRRITAPGNPKGALLISTGKEFIPYLDRIIAALDRQGKPGSDSPIEGTGMSRIAYTPRYRAAANFADMVDQTISSQVGKAYVNLETNTIFWRDQTEAANNTLDWVKKLDRPLPQIKVRFNYYELRDSDLKDWGFDYLAWKNGPGVNLLNLGYNAGGISVNQMIETVTGIASQTWGFGGFFTAPQFDMSFIRCLQQSGNASATASSALAMINTPVCSRADYLKLKQRQSAQENCAPAIYRISMYPEYQNIAKNTLGRSFVGKSYYEDEDGEKHSDPPALDLKVVNPFVCFSFEGEKIDEDGFIPDYPEFYRKKSSSHSGGVIFDYTLFFKNVVERGNTGGELKNSAVFTGSATLGFGNEKVLAVYEKENDVEQTLGLPILCRIPVLKYLFSTVTSIKERTYVIVTAEALMVHPEQGDTPFTASESTKIKRRIENPFRSDKKKPVKKAPAREIENKDLPVPADDKSQNENSKGK